MERTISNLISLVVSLIFIYTSTKHKLPLYFSDFKQWDKLLPSLKFPPYNKSINTYIHFSVDNFSSI